MSNTNMMKLKKNVAVSDSGFIFNPDTGESFTANPMGLEMLALMRSGADAGRISREITVKYNTDKDTVEKDYQDFVSMLKHHNLLEHVREEEA